MVEAKDTLRRPTVLVCDLVASTSIAETIGDEPLWDLLLEYQDACSEVIHRYDGTVYKRLGDGLLALFGIPRAHDDDASRAVHAGLALVAVVRQLAVGARDTHGVELALRVGIHTGDVMVGHIDGSLEVAGMAVHQADRLQSHAEENGVIVSGATAALLGEEFELRHRGEVDLRGVTAATTSYDVISAQDFLETPRVDDPVAMVGRSEERAAVGAAWREVAAGGSRVLLITGEAGIGKSRLARFARDHAARAGGVPLEGECSAYHADVPFHVIGRMISRHLALDPDAPRGERIDALAEMLRSVSMDADVAVPLLAPLVSLSLEPADGYPSLDMAPGEVAERTTRVIAEWWARSAAQEGRAIVIEDLHNADPSTIQLIKETVHDGLTPGEFLVLTSRPSKNLPAVDAASLIELKPLPIGEAKELLTSLSRDDSVPADEMIVRSGGNPLFLRELSRSRESREGTIPGGLRDLLMSRLDEAGDLELAQLASVIGGTIDPGLLEAVVSDGNVHERVKRLVRAGILAHHNDHKGRRLRFAHQLLGETAYESLPQRERRLVHSRLADVYLADSSGIHADSLAALHLDRAGRFEEAAHAYLKAADQASALGAFSEALSHLHHVEEIADDKLDGDQAEELLRVAVLRASFVLVAKEGFGSDAANARAERALALAPEESIIHTAGPRFTTFAQATILGQREEAEEIISSLETDLIRASESDRMQVEAEVASGRALHEFGLAHYTESRRKFERALALFYGAPRHGVPWAEWPLPTSLAATAYAQLIPIYWVQGDRSLSDEAVRRAKAAAEDLDPPMDAFNMAYAVGYVGWVQLLDGAAHSAVSTIREQGDLGREHGFAMWASLADAFGALAAALLEPSAELAERVADGRQSALINAGSSFQPYLLASEAEVRRRGGDIDRALALFDESIALAEETSEFIYLPETHRLKAAVLESETEAADALAKAYEMSMSQDAYVYALRALIDMADRPSRPDDLGDRVSNVLGAMGEPEAYPEHLRALELVSA